jgi:hypothetical protein
MYGMKVHTTVDADNAISIQVVNLLDDGAPHRNLHVYLDGTLKHTFASPIKAATNPATYVLDLPAVDTDYLIEFVAESPDRGMEIITELIDNANKCVFVPPVNDSYH